MGDVCRRPGGDRGGCVMVSGTALSVPVDVTWWLWSGLRNLPRCWIKVLTETVFFVLLQQGVSVRPNNFTLWRCLSGLISAFLDCMLISSCKALVGKPTTIFRPRTRLGAGAGGMSWPCLGSVPVYEQNPTAA